MQTFNINEQLQATALLQHHMVCLLQTTAHKGSKKIPYFH